MKRKPPFALIASAILAMFSTGTPTALAQGGNFQARGEELVKTVREHFYRPNEADAWAKTFGNFHARARDEVGYASLARKAIESLHASHTAYFTPRDIRYYGLTAIFRSYLKRESVTYESIGVDLTADHFVRIIFAGGSAAGAGLRRGDRILLADGQAFEPVESFRGRAGQAVALTVQRDRKGPPIMIKVTPRTVDPQVEWLEAQTTGSRILEAKGKKVAYVPYFSGAGGRHFEMLEQAIASDLAGADALIIDFRDGWGGCNPNFVNLFNKTPAVLTYENRADKTSGTLDAQWRKPLVLLINGGSTSGKEVVAYTVKKHRLGLLVGERTAGAVLGGTPFLMSDRSLLYLAVQDVWVDGERLEGNGVEPDVEVKDPLEYANGADPQLEKAVETAASMPGGLSLLGSDYDQLNVWGREAPTSTLDALRVACRRSSTDQAGPLPIRAPAIRAFTLKFDGK